MTDFARTLESEGWYVDTNLEDLSSLGPPLEASGSTNEERQANALTQLKELTYTSPASAAVTSESQHEAAQTRIQKQKKALILKNSHFGGHKFAGNVVVRRFPFHLSA